MQRAQIFCIGASSIYGVGGTKGSWADLLKLQLHEEQYSEGGSGEIHEVYNLAVPGAKIDDCKDKTSVELKVMSKPGRQIISIVQIVGNDALAIDTPDNFVSTPEQYREKLTDLLLSIKDLSDHVICLGSFPSDQSKTMPIMKDKEKNRKVYMPNERRRLFESIVGEISEELNLIFLPLFENANSVEWTEKYMYKDGIHPNDDGYMWLYNQIRPEIDKLLAQ